MFYHLLNFYTRHFSFPHRGLKYFLRIVQSLGIDGKTYKKKMPGNFYMWLMPEEHIQQQLFWYGAYEKEMGDVLQKIIRPGDVFLDIGANIGYFSLLAANREPDATVIAFEPASIIFERLKQNIALNNFKNIQTVNVAAGEFNEVKIFYLSAQDNMGMSSFHQPENFSGKYEKVKVFRIDDWFRQSGLSGINIIKMDIEGNELFALKGMRMILQKFRPLLIVEINPEILSRFRVKPEEVISFLTEHSFTEFVISESGKLLPLNTGQITYPCNALFVPREKINSISSLIK